MVVVGWFFSGFAPALVTCLFSLQVIKFFCDREVVHKGWFSLGLLGIAVTLGQWMALPEINGLNSAIEQAYTHKASAHENWQWGLFPILLIIRAVSSFASVAWRFQGEARIRCKSLLEGFLPAVIAGILAYSVRGGVNKAIEGIPSALSYPLVHYMVNLPSSISDFLFIAFFVALYADPVKKGAIHLFHDAQSLRSLFSQCDGGWPLFKSIMSGLFLMTAILFPPIAQWFQSEAAGEKTVLYLVVSAFASFLINRAGMGLFYPASSEDAALAARVEEIESLTYFSQAKRRLALCFLPAKQAERDPVADAEMVRAV